MFKRLFERLSNSGGIADWRFRTMPSLKFGE